MGSSLYVLFRLHMFAQGRIGIYVGPADCEVAKLRAAQKTAKQS